MEIAVLIIASIALVLTLITLIFVIRKSKANPNEEYDKKLQEMRDEQIKESAALSAKIDQLENSLKLSLSNEMKQETIQQMDKLKEQNNADAERLNKFQVTLTENINQQMAVLNTTLKVQTEQDTKRINDFQASILQQLTTSIDAINKRIDTQMNQINQKVDTSLQEGFKGTADSMASLQKEIGVLQEAQNNIDGLKTQISSLSDILTNNQKRGKYGEWQLELLLQNMFGETKGELYDTQYVLDNDPDEEHQLKPDAVIFLDGKEHKQILCIDSKFSLTGYEDLFSPNKELSTQEETTAKRNFRDALKKRVDETSKYVIKGKTVATAIMFIPNDGIFAYIEQEYPDLSDYARSKHVVIASPTILQPLLASFQIIQINNKRMKEVDVINKAITELSKDFKRFIPRWEDLYKRIQGLTKSSTEFDTTVGKIDRKFDRISGSQPTAIEDDTTPALAEQSE